MATRDPKLLTWQETSPGRWERGIDEAELFYTSLAKVWEGTGRVFFAMTGCAEVHVDISEHDDVDGVGKRLETALRKAWRRLRYDHPTLASAVEYDHSSQAYKKVYETFIDDEDGVKELEWLNKSFLIIKNGQSGIEFCNSDPPVQRYATLHIITPPEESQDNEQKSVRRDIVFRSHHDVIDGIGTLMLLNNLFRLTSQAYDPEAHFPTIPFGSEFHNLSPPLRIAANIPPDPTAAQRQKAALLIATNTTARTANIPSLHVPYNTTATTPGLNHRTAIHLSATETRAVLQRCRAAGISATEAFHAGIVLALRDLPGNLRSRPDDDDDDDDIDTGTDTDTAVRRRRRYINKCLINLRPVCAPPFNTARHAAAVYHSGSGRAFYVDVDMRPLRGPGRAGRAAGGATGEGVDEEEQKQRRRRQLQEDFKEVVSRVSVFYRTVREEKEHLAMVPLFYAAVTPTWPVRTAAAVAVEDAAEGAAEQGTLEIPKPSTHPSVSLSSLGILDRFITARHGAPPLLRVRSPWVAADEYSNGVGVFLATWEDSLCVSAGFNLAFHEVGSVRRFLEGVRGVVLEGLGLG